MCRLFPCIPYFGSLYFIKRYYGNENLNVCVKLIGLIAAIHFSNRKQRLVRNGQYSSWNNVHATVPQGSILVLLLFLCYINDLTADLSSNVKHFS